MAQNKILLKDKEIVKQRLAQGASTRGAIEGTSIKSNNTSARIKKEEVNDIAQIRKEYLALIEGFNAGQIDRAKLWAGMTQATKVISAIIVGKEADEKTNDFIEVPDWQNREKALKYIDTLAGINSEEKSFVQVNIQNVIEEKRKKYGF